IRTNIDPEKGNTDPVARYKEELVGPFFADGFDKALADLRARLIRGLVGSPPKLGGGGRGRDPRITQKTQIIKTEKPRLVFSVLIICVFCVIRGSLPSYPTPAPTRTSYPAWAPTAMPNPRRTNRSVKYSPAQVRKTK